MAVDKSVVNYFDFPGAAERYARSRPYFHEQVIIRLARLTGLNWFKLALDIGCGTGHSTLPLTRIAEYVIGVDSSAAMLAQATRHHRINYLQACAEALPFRDSSVDLITSGLSFHWFDQEQFLEESGRILARRGWLCIYNHYFTGEMLEKREFASWVQQIYSPRFPTLPRGSKAVTVDQASKHRLGIIQNDSFAHSTPFSREGLAAYLMSHSNMIAAVKEGTVTFETQQNWLLNELRPFFNNADSTELLFRCDIAVLQHAVTSRREQVTGAKSKFRTSDAAN